MYAALTEIGLRQCLRLKKFKNHNSTLKRAIIFNLNDQKHHIDVIFPQVTKTCTSSNDVSCTKLIQYYFSIFSIDWYLENKQKWHFKMSWGFRLQKPQALWQSDIMGSAQQLQEWDTLTNHLHKDHHWSHVTSSVWQTKQEVILFCGSDRSPSAHNQSTVISLSNTPVLNSNSWSLFSCICSCVYLWNMLPN